MFLYEHKHILSYKKAYEGQRKESQGGFLYGKTVRVCAVSLFVRFNDFSPWFVPSHIVIFTFQSCMSMDMALDILLNVRMGVEFIKNALVRSV